MTTSLRKTDRHAKCLAYLRDYIAVLPSSPVTQDFAHPHCSSVLGYCNDRYAPSSGDVCVNPIFRTNWRNCTQWKPPSGGPRGGWALDIASTAAVLDHAKFRLNYSPDTEQFNPNWLENRVLLAQPTQSKQIHARSTSEGRNDPRPSRPNIRSTKSTPNLNKGATPCPAAPPMPARDSVSKHAPPQPATLSREPSPPVKPDQLPQPLLHHKHKSQRLR